MLYIHNHVQTTATITDKKLHRRTIQTINEEYNPKDIYERITRKEWKYTKPHQAAYTCRDRAGMALTFLTAGRVSEIFGGYRFQTIYVSGLCTNPCDRGNFIEEKLLDTDGKPIRHKGLQFENISPSQMTLSL